MNNKDNTTADGFLVRRLKFAVGILENGGISERNSVNFGHSASQIFSRTACKNEYFIRIFFAHWLLILRVQRYDFFST